MMKRIFGLAAVALLGPMALGHFVFLLPQPDQQSVVAVFSDGDGPDKSVPISKIASTKLYTVKDGAKVPLEHKVQGNALMAKLPGDSNRVVFGRTDYGVVKKGDKAPFQLVYHPKTVLGDPFAPQAKVSPHAELEIVPLRAEGKTRFLVLAEGKPLADADLTFRYQGESESEKAKTDANGMAGSISRSGTVVVTALRLVNQPGESQGKAFQETRHYATLVIQMP